MTTDHEQGGAAAEPAGVRNEVTGAVTGAVVQAHTIIGGVHQHAAPHTVPTPQQLPAAPGWFTGRARELATLTAALEDTAGLGATVVISALAGAGGIGKTWLALRWANEHRDRFPDGQLFVNLQGFAPGQPMTPMSAVRGFLDAFGVDPGRIPVDLEAQVGLYRSLVAGRRMLIVLDNARDTSQVAPLLPGSPTCTVLVTSRDRLTGLVTAHGARPLPVDVLSESEARELLVARLGAGRVAAEPDAVAEVVACCGGFPLALSIVAGRAHAHSEFPLAVLATELREAATRLGALDEGEAAASVPAVLSWSYRALPVEQVRVLGLLGIAPGPDVSLPAASSLTALPTSRVGAVLRVLERVSLVQQDTPGRWRMHDLVRLYVAEHAGHDQPEADREMALRRLTDFYTHTAHTGDLLLHPHRMPIAVDPPIPGCHPLPDEAAALRWFDAEHSCLLATQDLAAARGWHTEVWHLAWTLSTFHQRRGHLHEHLATWQAGLAAAGHLDDPATQIRAHGLLGRACAEVGRPGEALEHLQHALALAEQVRDLPHQAHTHRALAWAWELRGEGRRALEHATHALHLFQALDHPVGEAAALNGVGWFSARLGQHAQARTHCEAALILYRRHHDRDGEAATLDSLGFIAQHTGDHIHALDYYRQALTLYRDVGHIYGVADTLDRLGQTYVALGEHEQARAVWREALELYQAQRRGEDAERVQHQLDTLDPPPDRRDEE